MSEEKNKVIRLPTIIPKKVLVIVLYPDRQIMVWGRLSKDGNTIDCKEIGRFTIPKDYRPKITWSKGKTFLTFYFDSYGNALDIKEDGEAKIVSPDPAFTKTIIDRGLLAKLFRLGLDWSSMITGIGLGVFAFSIIIFFILPLCGVPIAIGRGAVQVNVPQQPTIPQTGNFTFPP